MSAGGDEGADPRAWEVLHARQPQRTTSHLGGQAGLPLGGAGQGHPRQRSVLVQAVQGAEEVRLDSPHSRQATGSV